MMKLLFSGKAKYPDLDEGYALYVRRSKSGDVMDEAAYRRTIRMYCSELAERLYEEGMVDLPCGLGIITAATITRKPIYNDGKFCGYGAMNWKTGHRDGKLKTFGVVYLPRHNKRGSLRCYGFVANRRLFKRMKERHEGGFCPWQPLEFSDDMI